MFFTYLWRELRRRHRQALLSAAGLAVGVALVIAVSAYAGGVREAQEQVLQSLYGVGTDITISQTAKLGDGEANRFGMQPPDASDRGERFTRDAVVGVPGQQMMAASEVETVAAIDGVAAASGSLRLTAMHVEGRYAELEGGGSGGGGATGGSGGGGEQGEVPEAAPSMAPIEVSSFWICGADIDALDLGPLASGEVTTGRTFTGAETTAKVALLTKAYAKQNQLSVGDTLKLGGSRYEVVGIVTMPSGSTTSDVYVPLARAQKLAGEDGGVNQIYVRASSAERIAEVEAAIEEALPKATVTTSQDLADQVSGSLAGASSLADRLGTWLAVAALAASFAVAALLGSSAVSRRVREFGTLKALGWRSRRIVGQVLGESAAQGVLGAVAGAVLGLGAAQLIAAFSPALEATVGSAVQAPEGAPPGAAGALRALGGAAQTVAVELGAPVSPSVVLAAAGLAVGGGLLAGAFAGWRAARLRPADALRRLD